MTSILIKTEETQRRHKVTIPCDNRGRDWSDVCARQGLPITPEVKRKAWNRLSFRDF